MANLSLLHENKRPGALTEHLIANHEAREAFLLSDAGLLFTSKPLDREDRDSYMVTIVLGRKGIIRGKQAVQVKVRRRQILVLFSNCVPAASEKFNNSNDGIPLPRFVLLTRMTTAPALNNTSTRVTYLKTPMLAQKCYLPGKLPPQTPTSVIEMVSNWSCTGRTVTSSSWIRPMEMSTLLRTDLTERRRRSTICV